MQGHVQLIWVSNDVATLCWSQEVRTQMQDLYYAGHITSIQVWRKVWVVVTCNETLCVRARSLHNIKSY